MGAGAARVRHGLAFVDAEISRLLKFLQTRNSTLPLETEVNAALAVVAGAEPRNEIEAMLAVEMAEAHIVAVEMLRRARMMDPVLAAEQITATGAFATKLMRVWKQMVASAPVGPGAAPGPVSPHWRGARLTAVPKGKGRQRPPI